MVSNLDLYMPLAGFLMSFVLLLYSIASYREASALSALDSGEPLPRRPDAVVDESERVVAEISAEIAGFKAKIREMHEVVALKKTLHEQQIGEIIEGINGIVAKLEKADPEKVSVLQPSISKLVGELQTLRAPAAASSSQTQAGS